MSSETPRYGFDVRSLPGGCEVWLGRLPASVLPAGNAEAVELFAALWALRTDRPKFEVQGGVMEIARWQQAYARDYTFSNQTARALPIPEILLPFVAWARDVVDERLNGLLVNWYADRGGEVGEGRVSIEGDHMGPHRDSVRDLVEGAPIVTISVGGRRVFRMRPVDGEESYDFPVGHGRVIVLPFATNLAFTHEVPRPRSHERGRRISITLRAFAE